MAYILYLLDAETSFEQSTMEQDGRDKHNNIQFQLPWRAPSLPGCLISVGGPIRKLSSPKNHCVFLKALMLYLFLDTCLHGMKAVHEPAYCLKSLTLHFASSPSMHQACLNGSKAYFPSVWLMIPVLSPLSHQYKETRPGRVME